VVKLGIIKTISYLRMLINVRDQICPFTKEGCDVHLASTSTYSYRDVWLIDLGASIHLTPYMKWFCEYENYNGGDVFLGDVLTTKIIGGGRVKKVLKDGRIRNLPRVLHISDLAKSLIFVSQMSVVGIQIVFENETSKMV
jgi:hypothetical protein